MANFFGIDCSEYSFSYVGGYSEGKDTPELKASLNIIRMTAAQMIDEISEAMQEIKRERGIPEQATSLKEAADADLIEASEALPSEKSEDRKSVLADLEDKKEQTSGKRSKRNEHKKVKAREETL